MGMAEIYIIAGEYDLALDQIELLLSIPSVISVNWLQNDPVYDPLKDNQRFQKLVAED